MSKLGDWLKDARQDSEALRAKITARAGPGHNGDGLGMAEGITYAAALGAFKAADNDLRVTLFEVFEAIYCRRCGREQPDDPSEFCRCDEMN